MESRGIKVFLDSFPNQFHAVDDTREELARDQFLFFFFQGL